MQQSPAQLLKKFRAFYETRRVIMVFTRYCHWMPILIHMSLIQVLIPFH